MTNEEIEKSVDTILAVKTFLESVTPGSAAVKEFDKELKRFCAALVSQAYEEAAAALCDECAQGRSPHFEGGLWMHPYAPICPAGNIHDLKASLVKDRVPPLIHDFAERQRSQPAYLAGRNSPCDVLGLQPNMADTTHDLRRDKPEASQAKP